jgi:hypothetical protein
MKITLAQWREWEKNHWPAGYVWDDESKLNDGRDIDDLAASSEPGDLVIQIPEWWTCSWDGVEGELLCGGNGFTIRTLIRRWLKAQSHTQIVISIPKTELDAARKLIKERKWSLVA